MSIMNCYKCNELESLLYVCCNESQPLCFGCCKTVNCACGKKINKPYKPNNTSKSAIKIPRIITCLTCKEIIDQLKYFVSFSCSHYLCLPCICKAVQNKLKFQNWQLEMSRGGAQRYLECTCYSRKKQDIAYFLKDHCLCCGEDFKKDRKIQLKYGLTIKESCRRRIFYENGSQDILKQADLANITRTCRSCSNIIDGEIRTVGIQQYGDFQCSTCYNRSIGINIEEKDKQETCVSCDNKFSTFNLKLVDGFYLCHACLQRSKNTEEQNQIRIQKQKQKQEYKQKQNEVLKKKAKEEREKRVIKQASKCISCDREIIDKGNGQDNISCDKCLKEHMDQMEKLSKSRSKEQKSVSSSSPAKDKEQPKPYAKEVEKKNRFGINLEEQVKSELKKKVSLDEPSSKICINCNQSFKKQAGVESELSDLVCSKCINENIGAPAKRSVFQSISPPSHLKNEQIKYRSPQQQETWRKTVSYKEFLASRQVLKFSPSVGGQGRVEALVNRPQARRSEEREVMYTVIQEFPNKDLLEIAPPHPRTVDCGHCGYKLSRDQAIQHINRIGKQWQLCLSCFLVCQAKSL